MGTNDAKRHIVHLRGCQCVLLDGSSHKGCVKPTEHVMKHGELLHMMSLHVVSLPKSHPIGRFRWLSCRLRPNRTPSPTIPLGPAQLIGLECICPPACCWGYLEPIPCTKTLVLRSRASCRKSSVGRDGAARYFLTALFVPWCSADFRLVCLPWPAQHLGRSTAGFRGRRSVLYAGDIDFVVGATFSEISVVNLLARAACYKIAVFQDNSEHSADFGLVESLWRKC